MFCTISSFLYNIIFENCFNKKAIEAQTNNVAKWRTKEFENSSKTRPRFSIKNALEFIEKVNDVSLQDGDILMSVDSC